MRPAESSPCCAPRWSRAAASCILLRFAAAIRAHDRSLPTSDKLQFVAVQGRYDSRSRGRAQTDLASALAPITFGETMICRQCGGSIDSDSRFCPKCGEIAVMTAAVGALSPQPLGGAPRPLHTVAPGGPATPYS